MDAKTLGILLKVTARSCKVTPQYSLVLTISINLRFGLGGGRFRPLVGQTKVTRVTPCHRGPRLECIFQEPPDGERVLTIPNA